MSKQPTAVRANECRNTRAIGCDRPRDESLLSCIRKMAWDDGNSTTARRGVRVRAVFDMALLELALLMVVPPNSLGRVGVGSVSLHRAVLQQAYLELQKALLLAARQTCVFRSYI